METITCSCGAKVMRPIGASSLCGTCGKEVAATETPAKPPGEEAVRKDLGIDRAQSHGPRHLLPLKDEPPTGAR